MGQQYRNFTAAEKQAAVERMLGGETVAEVSRQLGVRRKLLYEWRERWQKGEPFRMRGRPPRSANPDPATLRELDKAKAQIAELQRKVGQQEMVLDFLKGALQRVTPLRRTEKEPGVTASSDTSRK